MYQILLPGKMNKSLLLSFLGAASVALLRVPDLSPLSRVCYRNVPIRQHIPARQMEVTQRQPTKYNDTACRYTNKIAYCFLFGILSPLKGYVIRSVPHASNTSIVEDEGVSSFLSEVSDISR